MSVSTKEFKVDNQAVSETLAKVLDSPPFRSSKQCQDLLRYVVEHSLSDDGEALKERVIGAEVFGRRPDYDTAGDPVVRNRAGDVRKRLALYYQTMPSDATIKLGIPHGSYRVEFRPFSESASGKPADNPSSAFSTSLVFDQSLTYEQIRQSSSSVPPEVAVGQATSVPPQPHWIRRNWLVTLFILVLIAAFVSLLSWLMHPSISAFESFWGPAFSSSKTPIICVGSSAIYRVRDESLPKFVPESSTPNAKALDREFIVNFRPGEMINSDDLESAQNKYVGVGDVAAILSITSMLTSSKKPYDLRFGADIVFGDLRQSPTILIGAFNNSWTIDMDDKLPFVFYQRKYIREVAPPYRSWTTARDAQKNATEDYALISRQLHSKAGEFSVTVAGIDMTGTRAAAEFVSDPTRMNQALKQLPTGWKARNLQLLLHSTILNGIPSRTEVIAHSIW